MMKTRYANRFLPEQKKILLWCYGFWFVVCFLSMTLAVEAKEQSCELNMAIVQEHEDLTEKSLVCEVSVLQPFLGLIPIS